MKSLILFAAMVGTASATTVANGGGTSASLFKTSTGVTLTATNSVFSIGTYNGSIFTQFAASDTTPMVIGSGVFAGKLTGNFSDNTAAASAFNNQIIWYRVAVDLGSGATGTAYFSGAEIGATVSTAPTKFPVNGNGAADTVNADTRNLTILGAGSTDGSAAYTPANGIVIGIIPETSTALLGALGALGLLRRRR